MFKKMRARMKKSKAFTLVELVVVVAILLILSVVALTTYNGIQDSAKIAALRADAATLASTLNTYNMLTTGPRIESFDTAQTLAMSSPWWGGDLVLNAGGGEGGEGTATAPADNKTGGTVTDDNKADICDASGLFTFGYPDLTGAVQYVTVKMSVENAKLCLSGDKSSGTYAKGKGATWYDDTSGTWNPATNDKLQQMALNGKVTE